jgi:hypothetical protein
LQDLKDQLSVKEEKIVQVLMMVDGAHKFIEDIMWKAHISAKLRIIKEELEKMKYDYL